MNPLSDQEFDELVKRATDAELWEPGRRRLLFFRIERLLGKIPAGDAPPPVEQLKRDLQYLYGTVTPAAGPTAGMPPLIVWILNARSLVADRPEQDFFETLAAKHGGEAAAPSLPASERVHNEAILFQDDMLPAGYLQRGADVSKSVVRLYTPRYENGARVAGKAYWGTGWLLTPSLLMTNHHVFNARDEKELDAGVADWQAQALATEVHFDVESPHAAVQAKSIVEVVTSDATLDFAVVRIDPVADRAPLRVDARPLLIKSGDIVPLNVVQHPNGLPKRIAIRNNLATASQPPTIRYFTSTYGGSSGSPVFNDEWNVVAIHCGSAATKVLSFQGRTTAIVNLGTQMAAIFKVLPKAVKDGATVVPAQ